MRLEPSLSSPDAVNAGAHAGSLRVTTSRFDWIRSRATPWIISAAFVLMAARLAVFVNSYTVNIVYWDQWDFLQGLFDGADAWTLFRWQHGPHRQGLGNLILAVLYPATGWNGRADAAASAVVLLLAAVAALWLVKRVCGRLHPWDSVVPLIFLTTSCAETYVVAPNLAHGPLPALLMVGYGLALTVKSHAIRCLTLVTLNFFAVNTGFTNFLGVITPVLLLVMASAPVVTSRERAVYFVGIALCAATLALFLHGLVPHSATDCFQFPHVRPWEYLPYMGFVVARPFGFRAVETPVYLIAASAAAVILAGLVAYTTVRLVRTRGDAVLWTVTSSLTGFALLFAAASAVGRVCLGLGSANASRYIPYMLPGMLAMYLVVRTHANRSHAALTLLLVFVVACVAKELPDVSEFEGGVYLRYKQRWRACYLATHDIGACDAFAGHAVYPNPEATHLQQKLDWLEARRYSLFRGLDRPGD